MLDHFNGERETDRTRREWYSTVIKICLDKLGVSGETTISQDINSYIALTEIDYKRAEISIAAAHIQESINAELSMLQGSDHHVVDRITTLSQAETRPFFNRVCASREESWGAQAASFPMQDCSSIVANLWSWLTGPQSSMAREGPAAPSLERSS